MPRLVKIPHKSKHIRKTYKRKVFELVTADEDSAKIVEPKEKEIPAYPKDYSHNPKADVLNCVPHSLNAITGKGVNADDMNGHVKCNIIPPVLQEISFQLQHNNVFPRVENIDQPAKPQGRLVRNVSGDVHICSKGNINKPESVVSVSTGVLTASREKIFTQRSLMVIAENCYTILKGSCIKNKNISEVVKECYQVLGSKPRASTIRDVVFELANQLGIPTVESQKVDDCNLNKSNSRPINNAVCEELKSLSNQVRPISNEALFRLQIHFHRKKILNFQFGKEEKVMSEEENKAKHEKYHTVAGSNGRDTTQAGIRRENIASHNHDVIMGREKSACNSPGNLHFLDVVTEYRHQYCFAKRKDKRFITKLIVERIRSLSPPGRFIQNEPGTDLWYDVGDDMAMEKVRQVLRRGRNIHSV